MKKLPKSNCNKKYDKINHCTFCEEIKNSRISRHLLNIHKLEPRIENIRKLKPKSQERENKLALLIKEGNFKHNCLVLANKTGCLIIARRDTPGKEKHRPEDYMPCPDFQLFVIKENLWHHALKCTERTTSTKPDYDDDEPLECESKGFANYLRRGRHLLYSSILLVGEDKLLSRLLERMNDGEEKDIIAKDKIIKKFALLGLESLGPVQIKKKNDVYTVNQAARTLARLVIEARKTRPCLTLEQLIHPDRFDVVVESTQSMCLDGKQALSLGKRMGHLLGHAIMVKKLAVH